MLYREIIAVCSQIHTKQINTLGRTVYLYVFNGSRNKQRLFPYAALTDWSL